MSLDFEDVSLMTGEGGCEIVQLLTRRCGKNRLAAAKLYFNLAGLLVLVRPETVEFS